MFIDEWFSDNFYKKLPLGYHANHCFGQIFTAHAYYPHENLELWRPIPKAGEPTSTLASAFRIVAAPSDSFRRTFPLESPKLGSKEEFIVVRAKIRPVVLLVPEAAPFGEENQGYRGKVQRRLCCVGQVFGLADPETKRREFNESFVDRVRRMEFPQLLFLPARSGLFSVDSILRLDELQSVFTPHLNPTQFALGDEVVEILRG